MPISDYRTWYEDLRTLIDCNVVGGPWFDLSACEPSFWVRWLNQDKSGSPQPYQQFAAVARGIGEERQADEVLYRAKERERENAESYFGWLGLTMLKYTIGYGVGAGYFRALWWIAAFTLFGAFVLRTDGRKPANRVRWCLGASLDEILPLVELNDQHKEFINKEIEGWRKAYFYVHRIVAYGLGSFVVAGLAGLTQGR